MKGGEAKRQAIQEVLRCIEDRLRELTLTAPDYESLSVRYLFLYTSLNQTHTLAGYSNNSTAVRPEKQSLVTRRVSRYCSPRRPGI